MTRMTALFTAAALSLGALALPAHAEEQNYRVQSGLLCDTAAQAARLSQLAQGGDFKAAIMKVNVEAAKPMACGYAQVAYTDEEVFAVLRASNGVMLFRIIQITVVGFKKGDGLQPVKPMTQFVLAPAISQEA